MSDNFFQSCISGFLDNYFLDILYQFIMIIIYIFHHILYNLKLCRTFVAVGHSGVLQMASGLLDNAFKQPYA